MYCSGVQYSFVIVHLRRKGGGTGIQGRLFICYLPIHIIFERLEAVTILNIWRVIRCNKVTSLPSGQ